MANPDTTAPVSDSIRNLRLIATKTGDLPLITSTAMKALQMTKDPDISMRHLQQVISQDQALTAKILRIVNSAMYCLSREVSTVSHAVTLLGMETVRSVIMAAAVQQVFQSGRVCSKDLGTKLLSDHSWGAALCARIIARWVGYSDLEEAFICGLMHDIGKPVLLQNLHSRYTPIIAEVYRGQITFHEAEIAALGFSHAQVGALLAIKWNFPSQLAEGIGYHHEPLAAPEFKQLACITSLANQVMVFLEIGFEKNRNLVLSEQAAAVYLKLTGGQIEEMLGEVRSAIAQKPDSFRF